jgi:hypothetical protein
MIRASLQKEAMTRPLPSGKQSVKLARPPVRVSRIRRDPPPPVKEVVLRDPREVERRDAIVGVIAFALAIVVIALAAVAWSGWPPREYTVVVKQ